MLYVRYIGSKVCWTELATERFFFGEVEELTEEERIICEEGVGEMPITPAKALTFALCGM